MKKAFLLILITLNCHFKSTAQGNLQFNQVLTYQGGISYSAGQNQGYSVNGPQWTVPQNKVWKVEAKSRTPEGSLKFMINGFNHNDLYERKDIGNNYFALAIDDSPIWLKSNDVINFYASGTCGWSCSGSATYSITIIEYNIVP